MENKITECDFNIEACQNKSHHPQKLGGYKIYINFYSDEAKQSLVSRRKLTITKEHGLHAKTGSPVYDIYSYNGNSTSKISKLLNDKNFSKETVEECKATIEAFNKRTQQADMDSQVLFVLDIKNFPKHPHDRSYSDKRSIDESENKILEFLKSDHDKGSQQAKAFRSLLLSTPLQFVILEGGLKAAFIEDNFLSDAEKLFLQTKGVGNLSFCQIIEFFLNAFKRGEQVTVKKYSDSGAIEKSTYDRTPYIKKLSEKGPDYVPTDISHTIYPLAYNHVATKGIYTTSMAKSTLFHIETIENSDQVVEMKTATKVLTS
ncbi:MAG: hypothetical protein Q8R83_07195 [Legionellaceae bacterium]|nr:hypothetical protein [Legionellaceae bacterium]